MAWFKANIHNESPGRLAWKRFRRNTSAMLALGYVLLLCIVALFAYLIIPDKSPDANRMALQIATKPPGFSSSFLMLKKEGAEVKGNFFSGYEDEYNYMPIKAWGAIDDTLWAEEYVDGNVKGPIHYYNSYNTVAQYYGRELLPNPDLKQQIIHDLINGNNRAVKTRTFILGTDRYGRDMFSRLILGARVSMLVGIIAVLISLLIGVTLGAIAGYFGGWVDSFIQWFINVIWSIPTILLVIAVSIALGKGFMQVFIAVGLTMWVEVARLVRGQVLSLRQMEFVEASKALGFSHMRAIFVHILPNISGPLAVVAASNFASAILIEAGLSFIGFGVQPPTASWGTMIRDHYGYIILDNAYLAVLPGLAIVSVVLAFILLGNGLRDAMDVKGVADR
jgi:ABC-type dipeptide/oligopeptide/nickel transport system permease subunit